MADIEITRPHNLDRDAALEKLKTLLSTFRAKRSDFIDRVDFSDYRADATGKHFEGTFEALADQVRVKVELTGFSGFSGRAKKAALKPLVKGRIEKALDVDFPG